MTEETTTETTTETSADTATETSTTEAPEVGASETDTSTEETSTDEGTFLGGSEEEEDESGDGDEGSSDEGENGVPEEYTISLKDADGNDVEMNPEMLGRATELFKEVGLNNEQANQLAPLGQELVTYGQQDALEQIAGAGDAQKQAWLQELKDDPDIGGSNLEQTQSLAATALDALGFTEGHEFRKLLNSSGFGNNRHMARVFRELGTMVSEDGTFARSDGASETEPVGWDSLYKQ